CLSGVAGNSARGALGCLGCMPIAPNVRAGLLAEPSPVPQFGSLVGVDYPTLCYVRHRHRPPAPRPTVGPASDRRRGVTNPYRELAIHDRGADPPTRAPCPK